jgi:hypothetical protein
MVRCLGDVKVHHLVAGQALRHRRALEALLPFEFELFRFETRKRFLVNDVRLVSASSDQIEIDDYVAAPTQL